MTTAEAMALSKGATISVRKARGKRSFRALVIDSPSQHGPYVLIPFAYASRSHGATVDTFSRHRHVAQIGGQFPDEIGLLP